MAEEEEEEVLEALAVAHSRQEVSLDHRVGTNAEVYVRDLMAARDPGRTEDLLILTRLIAAPPGKTARSSP